jgi:hypothetical protein
MFSGIITNESVKACLNDMLKCTYEYELALLKCTYGTLDPIFVDALSPPIYKIQPISHNDVKIPSYITDVVEKVRHIDNRLHLNTSIIGTQTRLKKLVTLQPYSEFMLQQKQSAIDIDTLNREKYATMLDEMVNECVHNYKSTITWYLALRTLGEYVINGQADDIFKHVLTFLLPFELEKIKLILSYNTVYRAIISDVYIQQLHLQLKLVHELKDSGACIITSSNSSNIGICLNLIIQLTGTIDELFPHDTQVTIYDNNNHSYTIVNIDIRNSQILSDPPKAYQHVDCPWTTNTSSDEFIYFNGLWKTNLCSMSKLYIAGHAMYKGMTNREYYSLISIAKLSFLYCLSKNCDIDVYCMDVNMLTEFWVDWYSFATSPIYINIQLSDLDTKYIKHLDKYTYYQCKNYTISRVLIDRFIKCPILVLSTPHIQFSRKDHKMKLKIPNNDSYDDYMECVRYDMCALRGTYFVNS